MNDKMETEVTADEKFSLLNPCDSKICTSVLHKLVDGICHRARPSYEDFSKVWSLQEWWTIADSVVDVFKAAVRETWTKDQLFSALGDLDDEHRSLFYDVLTSRQSELRQQMLADSHSISQATLSDFDWKLKLMMSSDKMSSVQEPVVSVDLDIASPSTGGPGRQSVSLELNKEELHSLISSLEAANKALVQLKS